MNTVSIGNYICKKRKALNLTQKQLADKINVSNKTISKWENGKCLPDYSVVESVCTELNITIAELLNGEDANVDSTITQDEKSIIDLIKRVQEMEQQRAALYGIMLIVLGISMLSMSSTIEGSSFKDFISGVLLGLSIGEILVGIYLTAKSYIQNN